HRIRKFTGDDLYAFARLFELPISFFLAPPDWVEEVAPPNARETTSRDESFNLCFGLGKEGRELLTERALKGPTTGYAADLVSWTADYKMVLDQFQRHLDSLAAI